MLLRVRRERLALRRARLRSPTARGLRPESAWNLGDPVNDLRIFEATGATSPTSAKNTGQEVEMEQQASDPLGADVMVTHILVVAQHIHPEVP
jgi:hypothetical protein